MKTKLQRKLTLDEEFASSETMTPGMYGAKLAAIDQEPDVEFPALDYPDIFATVSAVKSALETVAASVAPLLARVAALEKQMQFRNSTAIGGLSINASEITVDLSSLANSIVMLNEKLSQPVQAVFDNDGRVVGARRVPRLDS